MQVARQPSVHCPAGASHVGRIDRRQSAAAEQHARSAREPPKPGSPSSSASGAEAGRRDVGVGSSLGLADGLRRGGRASSVGRRCRLVGLPVLVPLARLPPCAAGVAEGAGRVRRGGRRCRARDRHPTWRALVAVAVARRCRCRPATGVVGRGGAPVPASAAEEARVRGRRGAGRRGCGPLLPRERDVAAVGDVQRGGAQRRVDPLPGLRRRTSRGPSRRWSARC